MKRFKADQSLTGYFNERNGATGAQRDTGYLTTTIATIRLAEV